MKLVKTTINSNIDFTKSFPIISKEFLDIALAKYTQNYTLNSTRVLVIHSDNDIVNIIMANEQRKILTKEIEFVVEKIFDDISSNISIERDNLVIFQKSLLKNNYKDVVLLNRK